ncbi:MAG TPA: beta-ketoacyl synthase N-terminal-like domain-containing protein [Trebonia sp.]|jgi:3-oxoacyl-[acyl-carrier-protein] synthase II|nr:beta-ketoacyl synthase N-terminal-like domain-containing protein [Trebonia sp.]
MVANIMGLGAVSGYGWGMSALWAGLSSRQPAGRRHHGLGGAFPDPCWFARVPEQDGPAAPGADVAPGSNRYQQGCAAAVQEAIDDARARGWRPGQRVGIVHATTRADLELMRARYLAPGSVSPRRAYVEQSWTTPSGLAMIRNGFTGPAVVVSAACSSGLHALAIGQRLLECGDATDVVVLSSDIGFDGEEMTLFASLGPLIYDTPPEDACRPFQEGTRGFVLGEGAAALVLTHSAAGAPYARLRATMLGNDAYHPVAIEPTHVEIIATVDRCLAKAGIKPQEVTALVAHSSGTVECREADTAVLDHLGPQATGAGLKPLLGHCMGTAPLLDAVAIARAHAEGGLPTHPPVADGHPRLARDLLPVGGPVLQLGIGFGGNVSAAVYEPAL